MYEYPYEFEIDGKLRLASIDGTQLEDETKDKQIEELKAEIEKFQSTMTVLENTMASIKTELEQVKQGKTDYNYTINTERKVGRWYDGSDMYELSIPMIVPNASQDGDLTSTNIINLQKYNIKECNIDEGFCVLDYKTIAPLPIWSNNGENAIGIRVFYDITTSTLKVINSRMAYNGAKGYVTLHYNKK